METANRWTIAIAGVFLQMALGAVYAWSVFRIPLSKQFHWSISDVTLTFTIAIFVLGFASFFGGQWQSRSGPRVVAITGGVLYGLGVFLASFSADKLWWLYLSYGVIGGIGLGLGYIIPVAVLVKWFPDKRGLMTGIAVGGFGAGALVTAPIATRLIASVGVLPTFAYLGIAYLIVTVITGWFMQNPPAGYTPAGWTPNTALASQRSARDYTLREALAAWQWWALWMLLFLNTCAGISVISQESPMFQDLAKVSCNCGCRYGRHRFHRQCVGPHFLGLGLRSRHTPHDLSHHVCDSGGPVLVPAKHPHNAADHYCELHHSHVLRRRLRHHARLRR